MKWIFIFVVLVVVGCKKADTKFSYVEALDSMQIPLNTMCICGTNDTLIFYPNQWVNERTLNTSISYQINHAPKITNNIFSISLNIVTDTTAYGGYSRYKDCKFYRLLNCNPIYSTFTRPTEKGTYLHCLNGDNITILPLL